MIFIPETPQPLSTEVYKNIVGFVSFLIVLYFWPDIKAELNNFSAI